MFSDLPVFVFSSVFVPCRGHDPVFGRASAFEVRLMREGSKWSATARFGLSSSVPGALNNIDSVAGTFGEDTVHPVRIGSLSSGCGRAGVCSSVLLRGCETRVGPYKGDGCGHGDCGRAVFAPCGVPAIAATSFAALIQRCLVVLGDSACVYAEPPPCVDVMVYASQTSFLMRDCPFEDAVPVGMQLVSGGVAAAMDEYSWPWQYPCKHEECAEHNPPREYAWARNRDGAEYWGVVGDEFDEDECLVVVVDDAPEVDDSAENLALWGCLAPDGGRVPLSDVTASPDPSLVSGADGVVIFPPRVLTPSPPLGSCDLPPGPRDWWDNAPPFSERLVCHRLFGREVQEWGEKLHYRWGRGSAKEARLLCVSAMCRTLDILSALSSATVAEYSDGDGVLVGRMTAAERACVRARMAELGSAVLVPVASLGVLLVDPWWRLLRRLVPWAVRVLGVGPGLFVGPLLAALSFQQSDRRRVGVLRRLILRLAPEYGPQLFCPALWTVSRYRAFHRTFFAEAFEHTGVAPPRINTIDLGSSELMRYEY